MALAAKQLTLDLANSQDHFDHLHQAAHGTVLLWEQANGRRWHKLEPGDPHIPAMLAAQRGQTDRYLSPNEFHGWRLIRLLKSLRALYVDIDGFEDLSLAREALSDARMPQPTAAVWSGRGLHLYWLIEPTRAQALPVWQRCQDALVRALLPLGADPSVKDCTRVLRMVGSINSKNGAEVRGLILDPQPFGFHHLCDEILGYREPYKAPALAKVRDLATARVTRGLTLPGVGIYKRWGLVYQDLLTIARWYDFGGIPEGFRDKWLFLSAVALSWFAHESTMQSELEQQAKIWTPGLSMPDIRSAIQSPLKRAGLAAQGKTVAFEGLEVDPRYRFERETLFDWLQPIIPNELEQRLRAIVGDKVRAEHKRETDAAHQAKRYATHHAASIERLAPWETLGISRATYFRKKALGTLT